MKVIQSKLLLAASIAAIMSGCAGTDSSGNLTDTTTNKVTGVVVSGEIDGFGSVIVDGVHYDIDSADIYIDGEPATEDDLEVGMVVDIDADKKEGKQPVAKRVDFFTKLGGAIEAIDIEAKTLTINGKVVIINAETHLGRSIDEVTLAPLAVGVVVRISGQTDSEGKLLASRIDIPPMSMDSPHPHDHLSGIVANLDLAKKTLTIDGQVVNFSAAKVEGTLIDGVRINLHGTITDKVFNAEKIDMTKTPSPNMQPHDHLSGTVTDLDLDASTLKIDGQVVNFSAATVEGTLIDGIRIMVHGTVTDDVFNAEGQLMVIKMPREAKKHINIKGSLTTIDGKLAIDGHTLIEIDAKDVINGELVDVKEGEIVRVEGELNDAGAIIVTKIKFEIATTVRIRGQVDAVDIENNTVTIDGEVFDVSASADFNDKTANHNRYFKLADLAAGDTVIINAYSRAEKRSVIKGIELVDGNDMKHFSGQVHSKIATIKDNILVTTSGITITLTETTKIAKAIDLAMLVLGEEGDELWITGTFEADGSLTAKDIKTRPALPGKDHTPPKDQTPPKDTNTPMPPKDVKPPVPPKDTNLPMPPKDIKPNGDKEMDAEDDVKAEVETEVETETSSI